MSGDGTESGPKPGAPEGAGPTSPDGTDDPPEPLDPRFTLANERTFLAWIRTGLALLVAGLAITQFFRPFAVVEGRRIVGLPLIVLGGAVAFWCFGRWRTVQSAMGRGRPVPSTNLPGYVAVVVGLIAVVAVVFVLLGTGT